MVKRITSLILLIGPCLAIALAIYGRFVEPRRVQVTELDLATNDDSLTIAFVTDTHVGPHFRARDLEPTISALEQIRPDILLFGGDFICESPRFLNELREPLSRMTATARLGSWGIWGNHDLANIRERCTPILAQAGVTMLTNAAAHLAGDLWVVGIDDVLLGKPDLATAFADVPADARSIALWHEPDVAERVVPYEPTLVLSGHTHGGQIRVPFIGPLAAPKLGEKYVAGHYNISGILLHVSRGIGMYRPPVRVNCRPEIVIIRA